MFEPLPVSAETALINRVVAALVAEHRCLWT